MKHFSELISKMEKTTKTNDKIKALVRYFHAAPPDDAIWALALLTGRRPKRPVRTSELKMWAAELAQLPIWLFEESYHVVGDLAETIALVLPPPVVKHDYPLSFLMNKFDEISKSDEAKKKELITEIWMGLGQTERFLFNKFITGGFRIGVSSKLVIKALAKYSGQAENVIAHRFTGNWTAENTTFGQLISDDPVIMEISKPYPFYLTYQMDKDTQKALDISDWLIEYKYDGIRGQIIYRDGQLFIWTRGEELVTEKFPEFEALKDVLPNGTVLDGEILPYKANQPLPFHMMQTRIGRKNISKRHLDESPLIMMVFDLLEYDGVDIRDMPLKDRRVLLEQLIDNKCPVLKLSPLLPCANWEDVEAYKNKAREEFCEGVMIKHKGSIYETGRKRGNWWKWKLAPYTVDGVLLYAQRGHGRRANLYTDYTFAVWKEDQLVPFTKAYSGLTDKEILQVDNWIKRNTLEKFGPVRSVKPELVFEIAFEGINFSPRHKSGVAVRFPRIKRRREDKNSKDANTHEDLLNLIKQ